MPHRIPVLVVRAGTRLCALPVRSVEEIMRPLPFSPLPDCDAFVRGLSRVRGQPAPVVDLAAVIGEPEAGTLERFVSIRLGGRYVLLAVGEVPGVRWIEPGTLNALPPLLRDAHGEVIRAIGRLDQQLLFLLEVGQLLPPGYLEAIPMGAQR